MKRIHSRKIAMNSRLRFSHLPFAICSLAMCGLAACSLNPFGAQDSDYAQRVAMSRLRDIEPARLDRYKATRPEPQVSPENVEKLRKRFDALEKLPLPLEECRASALKNNLDLQVAVVDPAIAAERVSQEDARFESAFNLRALWGEFDSATASQLTSAQSRLVQVEPSVTIPMRTGGTVSVGLPMAYNRTDNTFATLNPAYTSDLEFSISHPLLRNAGRRVNTAALRIAGYGAQASEARTKLEVIRQLAAVDRSYWRLYAAKRALEVTQQQYELATEQQSRAERRVRAGLSPEIEVTRAQAGVADRLGSIITSQNSVLLQQRELKRIINTPGLTIDTPTMVEPTTQPDPVEYVFDTHELSDAAVANRMEMLELELQLAADAANIDFSRNQTLPLVSLDYTYRINGLGSSIGKAFHQMADNDFTDWQLGLTAQVPLGNEAARSALRQAILVRIQRLSTKQARDLSIRQEVLNAADDITANWQRILAARQSVILNTRALQAEQRQFDVGSSTSTDVLDAAANLAQSQLTEIQALTAYQISQVDLAFATGTLLGASKVSWDTVAQPELGGPYPKEELPAALKEPGPGAP